MRQRHNFSEFEVAQARIGPQSLENLAIENVENRLHVQTLCAKGGQDDLQVQNIAYRNGNMQ